jgi:hypothetical protein
MEEIQIRNKRKIYQAIGVVGGILELRQSQYSSLRVGEDTYSVTVSKKVKERHEEGKLEGFRVYPSIIEGKLGFQLLRMMVEAPERAVMILKGCWTIYREEPRLIVYRNNKNSDAKTVLELIWEDAPIPTVKRRYWQIAAELKGEKFEVVEAIGPFTPPQKSRGKSANKSDVPRPVLKSARTLIAAIAPEEIQASAQTSADEPPEAELIVETASEPIAMGASGAIEQEETEASPVVAEPVTPKRKKASSKSTAAKKLSITEGASEAITPENTETEKTKSSSSKKQTGASATRLFLGKQLPPGK